MYEFKYVKLTSVEAAAECLSGDDEGVLLAGGMTLLPTMKQRLASPSQLLDLAGIKDLVGIQESNSRIVINAMTPHAMVASSDLVKSKIPALAALAGEIGDPQVRNRGTMGGSLANADPSADYPAAIVGLNAIVHTNHREIAADDFFIDMFETALEGNEIITSISFPIPDRAAYMKFPNPASRYAVVGVMVADTGGERRVAVTGARGSVFRWEEAEQTDASSDALDTLSISSDDMNEDIHASAEYRAHLTAVMFKRALAAI